MCSSLFGGSHHSRTAPLQPLGAPAFSSVLGFCLVARLWATRHSQRARLVFGSNSQAVALLFRESGGLVDGDRCTPVLRLHGSEDGRPDPKPVRARLFFS